jgi:phosphoribosylglycinamide formyltransferase-1
VNEEFDKGEILYQDKFEIPENATLEVVEQRIHQLEHVGMPIAVEQFLKRL